MRATKKMERKYLSQNEENLTDVPRFFISIRNSKSLFKSPYGLIKHVIGGYVNNNQGADLTDRKQADFVGVGFLGHLKGRRSLVSYRNTRFYIRNVGYHHVNKLAKFSIMHKMPKKTRSVSGTTRHNDKRSC